MERRKDNKGRVYDTIELNAESLQNAEEVNTSVSLDSSNRKETHSIRWGFEGVKRKRKENSRFYS